MIKTNLPYEKDYLELMKAFNLNVDLIADFSFDKNKLNGTIIIENNNFNYSYEKNYLDEDKFVKRFSKIIIYRALSEHFQFDLPYGALTGVHPTMVAYEYLNHYNNPKNAQFILMKDFLVREDKAKLLFEVIQNQNIITLNDKEIDLYIHIPFCVSRCTYCSFYSNDINRCSNTIEPYIDALINELTGIKEIINDKAYIVRNIYIGGGTPTSLNEKYLEFLLSNINFDVREFTVECGRPDTITEEKLKILKKYGVTRISINPQTFCDTTLKRIGRKHTSAQTIEAYSMALKYGFDINMDLIAGLPNESLSVFKKTLNTTIELYPTNITVHTLSIKRGALMANENINYDGKVSKMVEYAYAKLKANDYYPYYLYRQKNICDGQENIGYCIKGHQCVYNIDSIEEKTSIIAIGSGAISKKVCNNGEIIRQNNSKDLIDYIYRVSEYLDKKRKIF